MFFEPLEETSWFLFLKPFEVPIGADDALWAERMLVNRVVIFGTGLLLFFLALRRMERREKLLT